jgi:hypothetical protein
VTIGDGVTGIAPYWNYGNPDWCWGSLWDSSPRTVNVDLGAWKNRRVYLDIWVRDCLGHQTDAVALVHSIAIRECQTTPPAPLSPEDRAIFEDHPDDPIESGLTAAMQAALSCLRTAVDSVGGTLTLTSAYRSPSYQSHLLEVYKKWNELKKVDDPACLDLKAQLDAEMAWHKIKKTKRPSPSTGPHTRGVAFDANWSNVADIDALACPCGLYRPDKINDDVHFLLRPCPSNQ